MSRLALLEVFGATEPEAGAMVVLEVAAGVDEQRQVARLLVLFHPLDDGEAVRTTPSHASAVKSPRIARSLVFTAGHRSLSSRSDAISSASGRRAESDFAIISLGTGPRRVVSSIALSTWAGTGEER